MNYLYTILITFTLNCKYGQSLPQTISLAYKPNRPFYATGWTNYPSQIHPPGTPWPASAAGYTSTTTGKPWWATSTEEVVANAVSISSEVLAASSTTTTTTPAPPPSSTTTTTQTPPPSSTTRRTTTTRITTPRATPPSSTLDQTTLANTLDASTIATKVPPVQASTEGMLFTSAPEPAGGSSRPQGPPNQGSWSRPSMSASPVPSNLPPRMSSENNPTPAPADPLPNNPSLNPLNNPVSSTPISTSTAAASSTSGEVSASTPANTPSTVIAPSNAASALNLNSRFSRPGNIMGESQEAPEQAWVWEFHEGDGKTSSGEYYDVSAISFEFK